jgi:hypothetical protein
MISRGIRFVVAVVAARRQTRVLPLLLLLLLLLALSLSASCRRATQEDLATAPGTVLPTLIDPWQEAVLKVEEDRGELMGRQAQVEVPAQLKHYDNPRRFLGIQVAEWRKGRLQTPHDFAALVILIRKGELV